MKLSNLILAVSLLCIPSAGCSATTDPGQEEPGETSEALASGGLTLSVCRACGCSIRTRKENGCTVYDCVCPTEDAAKCAVNAPGGKAIPGRTLVEVPTKLPTLLTQ